MGKLIDLTGQKFGKLTVVGRAPNSKAGSVRWACLCDCGGTSTPEKRDLRSGYSTSCGCLVGNIKHGASIGEGTVEYEAWRSMRKRCFNTNGKRYKDYGGRGITVCERWNVFDNFLLDMGPRPSKKHSLDRIDNDGPYSPENCRWATMAEQSTNKSTNRYVTRGGVTKTLSQWAKVYGLKVSMLYSLMDAGYSLDAALLHIPRQKESWSHHE